MKNGLYKKPRVTICKVHSCGTLPPTATCGTFFSLVKVGSIACWLLNSARNNLLIGLFNVIILSFYITWTSAALILLSLLVSGSAIFPIFQSHHFNASSWRRTMSPTLGLNCTLFLYYNGIHVVLLGLYNSQVTKSSYTLYRHKI